MGLSESCTYQLYPGRILSEKYGLVYELENARGHVILPKESQDILEILMAKPSSIQEISQALHNQLGRVPFKLLFHTLERLQKAEALQAVSENSPSTSLELEAMVQASSPVSVDLLLLDKVQLPKATPFLFYAISIVSCFLGIAYFVSNDIKFTNNFLYLGKRYDLGIIIGLAFFSMMILFKNVVKSILSLLASGRIYDPKIRITPFSLTFHFDDNHIYELGGRGRAIVYAFTGITLPFVFVSILQRIGISQTILDQVVSLATLYVLVQLNPYTKSELSLGFKAFLNKDLSGAVKNYIKSKVLMTNLKTQFEGETQLLVYAVIAFGWTFASLNILFGAISSNILTIFSVVQKGSVTQGLCALAVGMFLVLSTSYLILDVLSTFFQNFTAPIKRRWDLLKLKTSFKALKMPETSLLSEKIRQSPVFSTLSDESIKGLIQRAKLKQYSPGSTIILQGTKGHEIYILLKGQVKIQAKEDSGLVQELATMGPGAVFGERAIYQSTPRTADVIAIEECEIFEFNAEDFLAIHAIEELISDTQKVLDSIHVSQFLSTHPLFSQLPSDTLQIFYSQGNVEHHIAGDVLFEQGSLGKDFYVIINGEVGVEKDGVPTASLSSGDFFGEIALLHTSARTATIRVLQNSCLLKITQEAFWKLLLSHVSLALYFENLADQRSQHETPAQGEAA